MKYLFLIPVLLVAVLIITLVLSFPIIRVRNMAEQEHQQNGQRRRLLS